MLLLSLIFNSICIRLPGDFYLLEDLQYQLLHVYRVRAL